MDRHKNFAYSTVATAPSPATTGTTLVVASGDGALFPVPPFNVTVWPVDEAPTADNAEILRVTGVSTDTLTIDREEEGTSARTVVVGDQIAATITSKTLEDAEKTSTKLITQTAHGLSVGEWVRLDSSGDYILAQADSAANSEVVGVVVVVYDANNFTLQRSGYVTAGLSGLTAGDVYYLDPDTPGEITDTNPTTDGDISKPVLIAESATTGWMAAEMRGVIVPGAGDPVTAAEVSIADAGGDFTATDVEGALAELQADHETDAQNLADHIADATDAHDASAISIVDAGNDFTATDVEGALAELQSDAEADVTALSDHISDTADAHDASAISADSTTLVGTGTDVQAVLEELDNAIADHLADTSDAHDASAISIADAGSDFTATDVEGALDELQADHEADATALSDHISDSSAAHAASAVSVSSATLSGTGTDVQAVFEEIDNLLDDHSARHENGGADEISIAGLDGTPVELTNHLNDSADAHDASAISVADSGGHFDATEVEAALTELAVAARIGRFFLSAAGMWPSTTSGAAANAKTEYGTNDVDMYGLAFDQTTQEFAQGTIAMPSDWDGGTITAQFYWTKTGTSTNSVVWGCAGRSYGDNEAIDQAFGTAQEATDAGQSATDMNHISSATPAITLAGTPAAGELVQFRVYRDPNNGSDTLATDAILLGVMIAYNRNI